jgi:hypothetical protein
MGFYFCSNERKVVLPLNFSPKLFTHPGKVKGGLPSPNPSRPHFVLGQKPDVPYCFMLNGKWALGFMTFALDQNPVCSMVHGSKLTGEPDPSGN